MLGPKGSTVRTVMRMSMRLCVSDNEEDEDSLQLQHGIRSTFLAPVWACITRCLPVSILSSTAQDGHLLQREGTPTCRFASAPRRSNNQQVYEACGDSSTRANDSTNNANAVVHLMQTHRKPSLDALLPTKEDHLTMQSAASTDPLFTKQGDEKGDALAIVPDSSPRTLRCLSNAPAPISPSNTNSKNIHVRLKQIAIFYPRQQIHSSRSSRNSLMNNLWIRINLYPILCVRCHLCNASPYTTIIYPKICRLSSPLWPFDPGIPTVHDLHHRTADSLQIDETQTVSLPPTSCYFPSSKGEYISRTKFKEGSRSSKQIHYRPNML